MPPKMVICSVCNQEVLKARTLARKDGTRACRNHPGVEEESADKQKQEKLEKERADKERNDKRNDMFKSHSTSNALEELAEFRKWAFNHCWTCSREGTPIREHYFNVIVAQKRLQLRGEFNFLSLGEDAKKLLGYDVAEVLAPVPYDDIKDKQIARAITNRRIKEILWVLSRVNMCIGCVDKFGMRERFESTLPKPTWEQMQVMMPVVDAISPLVEELAKEKERVN